MTSQANVRHSIRPLNVFSFLRPAIARRATSTSRQPGSAAVSGSSAPRAGGAGAGPIDIEGQGQAGQDSPEVSAVGLRRVVPRFDPVNQSYPFFHARRQHSSSFWTAPLRPSDRIRLWDILGPLPHTTAKPSRPFCRSGIWPRTIGKNWSVPSPRWRAEWERLCAGD